MDIDQVLAMLGHLVEALGTVLGDKCEVVLHDMRRPESSIVAIAHGEVTGRKVGDSSTNLGLPVLKNPYGDFDRYNYRSQTRAGTSLRSSSIFLKDGDGRIFAALCINQDISELTVAAAVLRQLIQTGEEVNETFASDIGEVVSQLIEEAIQSVRKPVAQMDKEDKLRVIQMLNDKDVFQVKHAVDRVAASLGISRVTVYGYLNEVQAMKDRNVV